MRVHAYAHRTITTRDHRRLRFRDGDARAFVSAPLAGRVLFRAEERRPVAAAASGVPAPAFLAGGLLGGLLASVPLAASLSDTSDVWGDFFDMSIRNT